MEDFVLVIVTSETCGHCHRYLSQQHQDLLTKLSGIGNLSIIHLTFGAKNEVSDKLIKGSVDGYTKYLGNIRKVIGWFPEFILFKKRSLLSTWKPGGKIDMWILNGNISTDQAGTMSVTPTSGGIPLTSDGISAWVLARLEENNLKPKVALPQTKRSSEILQSRGHGFIKPAMNFNLSSDIED